MDNLEKKRTMGLSVKEGGAFSVMAGAGDAYIAPFALSVGANNLLIGLISSLPALFSPIAQIIGARMMENHSRKKIMAVGTALQALMWLPIIALGLMHWYGFSTAVPTILIITYTIYSIFGATGGPAWFSLLGDIVPARIRGKYFGKRNKVCTAVMITATVLAAFVLDYFKTKGLVLLGFSVLFFIAFIARAISAYLLNRYYDPPFKLEEGYYFSFWQFVKKAPTNNFGKFAIYTGMLYFTVLMAGPFFTVYMLKHLHFSYTTLMFVNISAPVFTLIFSPVLGKFADKYGNRELLKFGGIIIPSLPLFWLFSGNPWYLAFVPQLISGLGWAAFNLAASNFIYDTVTPQRRGICLTYFNIFINAGTFLGAAVGGIIATYAPIRFMDNLLFIFLLSGILRGLASIIMLPKIKEVREVITPSSNPLIYIKELNLVEGVVYETLNDVKVLQNRFFKRGN